jgi:hypothetical protein
MKPGRCWIYTHVLHLDDLKRKYWDKVFFAYIDWFLRCDVVKVGYRDVEVAVGFIRLNRQMCGKVIVYAY